MSKPKQRANNKRQPRDEYPVATGQEAKAMMTALSDGKTGRNWRNVSGDEIRVHEKQRDALPLRGWQDDWLNGVVEIRPGPAILDAVKGRADALPEPTPRTNHRRAQTAAAEKL